MSDKVLNGWRVMAHTGHRIHPDDRWEVYGPNGGGVVNAGDVRDWAVRGLLDALAEKGGACVAQSAPVENDPFVPGSLADLLFQLGEKGVGVSGGTHGDRWRVSLPQTAAAQSAPAGEREAFEAIYGTIKPEDNADEEDVATYALEWLAFQAGAAQQRTQSAGVPEGWREELNLIRAVLEGYTPSVVRNDALRAVKKLAAAPAQPASPAQSEVQRLREALERIARCDNWGIQQIALEALAASTGQEV